MVGANRSGTGDWLPGAHRQHRSRGKCQDLDDRTVSLHVLPVGPCASVFGAGGPSTGPAWEPTKLAAAMPDASAGKLEFYSAGTERFLHNNQEHTSELQ